MFSMRSFTWTHFPMTQTCSFLSYIITEYLASAFAPINIYYIHKKLPWASLQIRVVCGGCGQWMTDCVWKVWSMDDKLCVEGVVNGWQTVCGGCGQWMTDRQVVCRGYINNGLIMSGWTWNYEFSDNEQNCRLRKGKDYGQMDNNKTTGLQDGN